MEVKGMTFAQYPFDQTAYANNFMQFFFVWGRITHQVVCPSD